MAPKPRSLLLFSLLCLSFSINVLLLLRSSPGEVNSSRKFSTRAVDLETDPDAVSREALRPPPSVAPLPSKKQTPSLESSIPKVPTGPPQFDAPQFSNTPSAGPQPVVRLSEHTQIAKIGPTEDSWAVYEDLSQRDGDIVFQNSKTQERRIFPKRSEATFYNDDKKWKKYAGIPMAKIGMDLRDLLADKLLQDGEPDEEAVRSTIPPMNSLITKATRSQWSTFVGNVEANDNVAIYGYGFTKSYHPIQYFPKIADFAQRSYEGLLGGYMPAVRKILVGSNLDDSEYYEILIFGDTDIRDPFVVSTTPADTQNKLLLLHKEC